MKSYSPFRQKVYEVVKQIPKGKVATYGQVAALAGNPKAARAVGNYMRQNPDQRTIPCHRVVGAGGALIGFSFGMVEDKKKLLEEEEVLFIKKSDKVDLKRSGWRKY